MPDPILMLKAFAAAIFASALVAGVGRLVGRRWAAASQAVAIALGIAAGLATLNVHPRWPMREDQDRFLGLVLPAVILMEAWLGSVRIPGWSRIGARLLTSAAVAPALLFGSSYVADLAGPVSATWPPAERYAILAGLAAALFAGWWLLDWTARRSGSAFRVPFALAGATAGASACVMLSSYATGGMNGLPIAGALAGAAIAAALLRGDDRDALPGVGIVALSGLLLSGYAFGELQPDAGVALFVAPLLCAIPEAPPLVRLKPWARSAIALALVATAAAAVVGLTLHRFQASAASQTADDPYDAYR